jgi:hypothetical protein
MKKAVLVLTVLLFTFSTLALSACKQEEEEPAPLKFAKFLLSSEFKNGWSKTVGNYRYYLAFRDDGSIFLEKQEINYHGQSVGPYVRIAEYNKIDEIITVKELNKTTYFFAKDKTSNFVDCTGEEIEFVYLGGEQLPKPWR